MLCQQLSERAQRVLHLQCRTFHFPLAQLHLQQVVAVDGAYAYGIAHVLLQLHQHLMDGAQRQQFLLERHHLPVILLSDELDLVFRRLKLDFARLDARLCQFVAVDDLSAHEHWLNGTNGAEHAILHKGDVGGPCGADAGGKLACQLVGQAEIGL